MQVYFYLFKGAGRFEMNNCIKIVFFSKPMTLFFWCISKSVFLFSAVSMSEFAGFKNIICLYMNDKKCMKSLVPLGGGDL